MQWQGTSCMYIELRIPALSGNGAYEDKLTGSNAKNAANVVKHHQQWTCQTPLLKACITFVRAGVPHWASPCPLAS